MAQRHTAIAHWAEIENSKPFSYDGSDEPMAFGKPLLGGQILSWTVSPVAGMPG